MAQTSYPTLNPNIPPAPTSTIADDTTSASQNDINQSTEIFTPLPNLLKSYASYSPVLSLLVTNTANYNTFIKNQKFYPQDWNIICKSGGVGPNKATGFNNGTNQYFSKDLYIDSATVNTLVGMSQDNRGSNATDIDITIVEPYGMDFIEQLYDYCTKALGEQNYCQIPYLLKIEFKGYKDDGTFEVVPYATKYIPIHLVTMDIKVNNLGAIYKISAIAFNELGNTELYGRIPATLQLGTALALAQANGLDQQTYNAVREGSASLGQEAVFNAAYGKTLVQNSSDYFPFSSTTGTAAVADVGSGGTLHLITSAFAQLLNNIQNTLVANGSIAFPDVYSISYTPLQTQNDTIDIGQYLFLDTNTLATIVPVVGKDAPMGQPANQTNQSSNSDKTALNLNILGKNMLRYVVDPTTGTTENGAVTYTNPHLISFNSGSSILDCLNTLITNSNYIVTQINQYNTAVNKIIDLASQSNLQVGAPIPAALQAQINALTATPLYWFQITPMISINAYDPIRGIYSRSINYNIQPYKIYNARSISAPNADPVADNRVVKEYDYIFTGKNTEILSFDLNFNNAFLTYAQFNHDTKIQGTGAGMPAKQNQSLASYILQTISSPITNGQSKKFVSSSNKIPLGVGAITPERNQASDVVSTLYAPAEQIQLEFDIFGDPDYIRQDGIFINPTINTAFMMPNASNAVRGIMFNSGEVYANVNFKIPQDINLNTGVLDLAFQGNAINYQRNIFSGHYRVLQIANKFDKGLFTQHLSMIRYDDSHNYTVNPEIAKVVTNSETTQQITSSTAESLYHPVNTANPTTLSLSGAFPVSTLTLGLIGEEFGNAFSVAKSAFTNLP